jgi:2-phospho-L-lactate guanylyltransferase
MTGHTGVLLVPQKDLDRAKSRMFLAPARRRDLAVAMLRRTVRSASEAQFAAVLVVLDNPADASVIADLDVIAFHPGVSGLNASLAAAEEAARSMYGAVPLTVMPSDLALATPALLDRATRWAARHERAFIPDSSGRGTTMLFAGPGVALSPAYGLGSADAHERQGARRMLRDDLDLLRHDVDDLADLAVMNLRFEDVQRWEETA